MKRMISLMLLAALLVSCGEQTGAADTETSQNVTDTAVEETTLFEKDSLPELNFGGKDYTILVNQTQLYSFDVAEQTGDVVDDAVYHARLDVEQRLNCQLHYISGPGSESWNTRQQNFDYVTASVMADTDDFDALDNQSYMGVYFMNGLLMDMSKMRYIDLSKPWWDSSITESMAVNGKYPFLAGSYSLEKTSGTFCFFFNKKIAEELKLPDLYQLVYDGGWNIDTLMTYTEAAYSDLNGDTVQDENDRLGLVMEGSNYITGFYEACGVNALKKNKDGFTFDFDNAHNVDVVEKVIKLVNGTPGAMRHGGDSGSYLAEDALFKNGNVLFTGGWLRCAESYRDLTFDFGILPYPKYDENQKDYTGGVLTIYGLLGVPKSCNDPDSVSAVLEALSSQYYRTVVPAYYEKALKLKYSRDDETIQMIDFISSHIVYDTGLAFAGAFDYTIDVKFKSAIQQSQGWASVMASLKPSIVEKTEQLNLAFGDLG